MAYIPDILPYDIKLFPKYLNNELLKIEESLISQKDLLSLSTTNVAPSKVDEGDIRFGLKYMNQYYSGFKWSASICETIFLPSVGVTHRNASSRFFERSSILFLC